MDKFIQLTKDYQTLVSEEDYPELNKYLWYAHKAGSMVYAARYDYAGRQRELVYMHRVIAQPDPGKVVDHINRNTLDNRRSNLRCVTIGENNYNRSCSNLN